MAASNVPVERISNLKVYQGGRLMLLKVSSHFATLKFCFNQTRTSQDAHLSTEDVDEVRLLVDVLGPSLAPGFVYVV